MTDRYDPAEARRLQTAKQTDGLDLFGHWPEARPATDEQEALALPGATIRGNYVIWRATPDGDQVYRAFCAAAREDAAQGRRLTAKGIVERVRAALRLEINNSFTALLSRDAASDYPELRGRFELRQRKAA